MSGSNLIKLRWQNVHICNCIDPTGAQFSDVPSTLCARHANYRPTFTYQSAANLHNHASAGLLISLAAECGRIWAQDDSWDIDEAAYSTNCLRSLLKAGRLNQGNDCHIAALKRVALAAARRRYLTLPATSGPGRGLKHWANRRPSLTATVPWRMPQSKSASKMPVIVLVEY